MNRSWLNRLSCYRPIAAACICASLIVTGWFGSGCATFPTPDAAAQAPLGLAMRLDPFLVYADFRMAQGDPIAQDLQELKRRIEAALELALPDRPIGIYIFDDRPSYERFMRANYPELPARRAFFIAQGQRLAVYAFRDANLAEDLRHETTHALLHAAVGRVPLWLDEGIAEYFEAPPNPRHLHARHRADLQTWTEQGWNPALTRLEGLTQVHDMSRRDYGEAWGWVYFMLHSSEETRAILLDYLKELSGGDVQEPLSSRLFIAVSRPDVQMVALLRGM